MRLWIENYLVVIRALVLPQPVRAHMQRISPGLHQYFCQRLAFINGERALASPNLNSVHQRLDRKVLSQPLLDFFNNRRHETSPVFPILHPVFVIPLIPES